MNKEYDLFLEEFKNHSNNFTDLFSNIFTMREIGNKTHGDLAEIAINEFINVYCDNYSSIHVGKELFRRKKEEEDIIVVNETNNIEIPISIKAYGSGPLQLSTDKEHLIFPYLESFNKELFTEQEEINNILNNDIFDPLSKINILPIIYKEDDRKCNILVFDFEKNKKLVTSIKKIMPGGRRKYPIYVAYNNDNYLFEIRYGGKDANALQRGVWTNSNKAENYFQSISNGWIQYETRENLLKLLSILLVQDNNYFDKIIMKGNSI